MYFIIEIYKLLVLQYFVYTCFTQTNLSIHSFVAYNLILTKMRMQICKYAYILLLKKKEKKYI